MSENQDLSSSEADNSQSFQSAFATSGSRLRRGANGEVDVMHAVGGVRGIIEALLPGFLFLCAFLFTQNLMMSLMTAGAIALCFAVVRLVQRGALVQSLSGFVGVLICAWSAMHSGNAVGYYLPGLWTNFAYTLAIFVSLMVRWPLLGVIYSFARGESETWRTTPARYSAYWRATWVMLAMFALRLVVQVPLYFAQDVAWLGIARLFMGTPLYLAVLWLTWMMTRTPADVEATEDEPQKPRR